MMTFFFFFSHQVFRQNNEVFRQVEGQLKLVAGQVKLHLNILYTPDENIKPGFTDTGRQADMRTWVYPYGSQVSDFTCLCAAYVCYLESCLSLSVC